MLYQKKQKSKKLVFEPISAVIFTFRHSLLTSHVSKLAKLLFFEADNIAILFFSFFVLFLIHIKLTSTLPIFCFKYIDRYFKRKNSLNLK